MTDKPSNRSSDQYSKHRTGTFNRRKDQAKNRADCRATSWADDDPATILQHR
jgi:hypothetical protein